GADHRGPPLEHLSAGELPSPFLCQPGGERGDLRAGGARLRIGARCDRESDRGRLSRGGRMKIGGRSPPFPDAELIRMLAALLTETGLTEIEYAIGDRRIRIAR